MAHEKLNVSIGYATDKGIKSENEDFFGSLIPENAQLTHKGISVAIADGMSHSEAGKEASHCCITSFLADYYSTPDSWSVKKSAQKILSATNSWLYSQGHQRYNSAQGMVCTLSAIVFKSATAHIFHIGDSRIYRLRKGNLELMTHDHRINLANNKNYLSRAMGIEPHLEVDYRSFPLEIGDVFLMTTDGIHDFISDKNLKRHLNNNLDLNTCAYEILKASLENQSDDNLTCQLVKIESLPLAKEDEILRQHANLPFPPPLDIGMTLDGYTVEAELHASKRTQIYLAFDQQNQQQVILKTPSILFEDDTHYIEHFLHEEWAGKRLNHKNILKVLGSDRKKSCIYYVTEFIDGQTLREWIDENQKPYIREIRPIIAQLINGLNAFHRMEMLHQDLKPENIMLTSDGTVKIIDFGSVKIAGISEISPLDHGEDENILGTLNYTAPEYHLGQRGSIKSDLYSVGIITYEMINHALPFGAEFPEKPNKINLAKLYYQASFTHNAMVPIWIDGALKKATSLNPQLRYEQLSEFKYDLNTPNPQFLKSDLNVPILHSNPLLFWKIISSLLLLGNLILIYFLSLE